MELANLVIKGHVVIVDACDVERLSCVKWSLTTNGSGLKYVRSSSSIGRTQMHRFILGVTDASLLVDHINRNTLDNRRENLRVCNKNESNRNRKGGGKVSRFKGVNKNSINRWCACMKIDGKNVWLGTFKNEEDAARAYDRAALAAYGEFAYLNFPAQQTASAS